MYKSELKKKSRLKEISPKKNSKLNPARVKIFMFKKIN